MASDPLFRSTFPPQNDCLGRTCPKGQRNGELSGADLQVIVDRLVEMDEEGVDLVRCPLESDIPVPSPSADPSPSPGFHPPVEAPPMKNDPTLRRTRAAAALHRLEKLARRDPGCATALRHCDTTEEAAAIARRHGIEVSPEAIWRHRGTLLPGGQPTWRG